MSDEKKKIVNLRWPRMATPFIVIQCKQGTKKFNPPKTADFLCQKIGGGAISLLRKEDEVSFAGVDVVEARKYHAEYPLG